jgi:hypothetical protein
LDRILLETDAPDALPRLDNVSVSPVPVHSSDADTEKCHIDSESQAANASNESLNHPENIHIVSFFFLACTYLKFLSRSFFLTYFVLFVGTITILVPQLLLETQFHP